MFPDYSWYYEIPTTNAALLMVAAFVGFYWVGAVIVRPILRIVVRRAAGLNDLIGYILSCFCVFYGLLLGLIAVTAYQNVESAEQNVTREAAALSGALRGRLGAIPIPTAKTSAG